MPVYTHSISPFLISPISPLCKTVASPVGIALTAFDASPRFLQSPTEKSWYGRMRARMGNFGGRIIRMRCFQHPTDGILSVSRNFLYGTDGGFLYILEPVEVDPDRSLLGTHRKPKNLTRIESVLVNADRSPYEPFAALKLNIKQREHFWWQNSHKGVILSALNGWNSGIESAGTKITRKRKIVEHLYLLRAREDLSDDEEKDMFDYLYTSQYQMRGIIAISLGRIMDLNVEGFTHAVYMRFQRKEDLSKFYENVYSGLLREHVMPYCHGWINIDYESEVEDDILPIFRKGEEFNYGVEFMLLISVSGSAIGGPAEDALATFTDLTKEFGSLIVQATQGSNFNPCDREYTHAVVIRFPSIEALELFRNSSEYKDMWNLKFQPITQKSLAIHFAVDPVGTEIM